MMFATFIYLKLLYAKQNLTHKNIRIKNGFVGSGVSIFKFFVLPHSDMSDVETWLRHAVSVSW